MLVHLIALTKKTLIKAERYTCQLNTAKAEIMKKTQIWLSNNEKIKEENLVSKIQREH